MAAIGTPGSRLPGGSRKEQNLPPPPGETTDAVKQGAARGRRCGIMAKDDPGPWGKRRHTGQELIPQPLIGHQPKAGQRPLANQCRVVALSHRAAYSALMTQDAKARLAEVEAQIARACKVAGRARETVSLVAVSKTKSVEEIRPLIALGQRVFGENRVQEAQAKWPALIAQTPGIELHLVGQLQSNKAEDAVQLFDVIHSVDRASLISALARAQDKTGRRPRCFLQVNIGAEAQKAGCSPAEVADLLKAAHAAGLTIIGLMAVPPAKTEAAPYFALLAKLARDNGLGELSMGMSADLEAAVMLGASYVRIGTALFGERA